MSAIVGTPRLATAERPRLVVLDLTAERGLDAGLVRLLNELLLTEFQASGRFRVTGGSDIQAIIQNESRRELLECDSTACLAELGGALGADYLASANIGRVGDYYLLNVKVLHVPTAEVVSRWSTQVEGVENRLMSAVRSSVEKVLQIENENATATAGASKAAQANPRANSNEEAARSTPADSSQTVALVSPTTTRPQSSSDTSGAKEDSQSLWLWSGVGVTVVASTVGVLFGVKARNELKYSRVDPRYAEAREQAAGSATIANVSFGVAGAAALTTVLVYFLRSTDDGAQETDVGIGTQGTSGAGVFWCSTF